MKNRIIYIVILLITFMNYYAQDIHFSQADLTPINLSTSNTGLFDENYRMGIIYRTQWNSVPVAYQSLSVFGDAKSKIGKNIIGHGLLYNKDVAGDGKFAIQQFYLNGSFNRSITKDSTLFAGIGAQIGMVNWGFKTNNLKYDNQYNGVGYDPNLPTGEGYDRL